MRNTVAKAMIASFDQGLLGVEAERLSVPGNNQYAFGRSSHRTSMTVEGHDAIGFAME